MSFLSFPLATGQLWVLLLPVRSQCKRPARKQEDISHAAFSAAQIFFAAEDNGGSWYVPAYETRQSANVAKDAVNFGVWESFHSVAEIRLAPEVARTLARGSAARTAVHSVCHF